MVSSVTTESAVLAVNSLLHLCPDDQASLVDVINDYFTTVGPGDEGSDSDIDSDSDCESETGEGKEYERRRKRRAETQDDEVNNETQNNEESGSELGNDGQLAEAMSRLPLLADVSTEPHPSDVHDEEIVREFMLSGCGCLKWNGKECSAQFNNDYVESTRANCQELSHDELDMVILGQLLATANISSTVVRDSSAREKAYATQYHQGKAVCTRMFRFLHSVGRKRVNNLVKSLKQNGLRPRAHGNSKRLPKHSLSFPSVEYVVRFLLNYSEQNAILLPGRVPGYKRSDMKLLPSSASKHTIWRVYHTAAELSADIHAVAYTTFCRLWRSLLPSVIIMKPMSDLCWQCQQNSTAILRAANCPEAEKSETIRAAEEHLRIVRMERSHYKTTCGDCRKEVREFFLVDGKFQPPPLSSRIPANSNAVRVHYSFDYAQQVHYPSDPLQPGPLYFLTPRKCGVFGINCEALPRQVNFLMDEAGDCGKGANVVVSQLHYFFEQHGLGEEEVFLHADNCTGQNKNNCMIQYLAWRAMTNRHTKLTLSFLVVGHTKFAPDWCFGLFKRLYRRTRVGSLKDIAQVANTSAQCNFAQLASSEDGTSVVPIYDWTDYFSSHMKKVKGIKKIQHFRFDSSDPGVVYLRNQVDTPERSVDVLKAPWTPEKALLPTNIHPKGLSAERQWYLHDYIRQFCPDGDKDITCPLPVVPKPTSRAGTPVPTEENDPPSSAKPPLPTRQLAAPPSSKRKRTCRICRVEGHNSRSCLSKEI